MIKYNALKNIPLKVKIFLPIFISIILSVSVITVQMVRESKKSLIQALKNDLSLEVQTITKMFERESELKTNKVKTHLKVIRHRFNNAEFEISKETYSAEVSNQITKKKHTAQIKKWTLNENDISSDFSFVDNVKESLSGTATIFQKIDSGYVRISTNVPTLNSERAVNTFIPNESPVIQTIEKGNIFYGRAYVVNDRYITAYEPIRYNNRIVGMYYVGNKEKNLTKLKKILSSLKFRQSGKIHIVSPEGGSIYQSAKDSKKLFPKSVFSEIQKKKTGTITFLNPKKKDRRILSFNYFSGFDIYIIAEVTEKEETSSLIKKMVSNSAATSAFILIFMILVIFFITNEGIKQYLYKIESSKNKLKYTKQQLEFSENKFKTLFNYSGDEIFLSTLSGKIIEANNVACESLQFTKDELLNKNFSDLKTKKYRHKVQDNIRMITKKKRYTYETEHIAKDGSVTSSEMKSRLIHFNGQPAILSVSRNITDRKRIQKEILKTVMATEEKERRRFAADLHDGLGPILSTIRLYTDLLRSKLEAQAKELELVDNIEELTDLAISSAKEISNNITPQILHDFGLAKAIEEFCKFLNKTKSVKIKTDTSGYTIEERIFSESVLFQTSKELINNTIKHAQAKNITIELKNTKTKIFLYYRDDGKGFNVSQMMNESTGLGLSNIRNKIKTIKGSCDFNSQPEKGMFVMISVDISKPKDKKQ